MPRHREINELLARGIIRHLASSEDGGLLERAILVGPRQVVYSFGYGGAGSGSSLNTQVFPA